MEQRRHTTTQMIRLLGEAEVAQLTTDEVCRQRNSSGQTDSRWRSKDGSMRVKEGRRLKQLEKESSSLRKLVADPSLDKHILQQIVSKKL